MVKTFGQLTGYEFEGEIVINLCLHDLSVRSKNGTIKIPQSGMVARGKRSQNDIEEFAGFAIIRPVYSEIYGLPEPVENTIYVVSAEVLNLLNDSRGDIVSPGKLHKDSFGKTQYTESFRRQF